MEWNFVGIYVQLIYDNFLSKLFSGYYSVINVTLSDPLTLMLCIS